MLPRRRPVDGRRANLRDHPAAPVRRLPLKPRGTRRASGAPFPLRGFDLCHGPPSLCPHPSISCIVPASGRTACSPATLRDADLTPRQFAILQAVADKSGLSQTDIMAATGIDRSSTAELVRRLVTNGVCSGGGRGGMRASTQCASQPMAANCWRLARRRPALPRTHCCYRFLKSNVRLSSRCSRESPSPMPPERLSMPGASQSTTFGGAR